MGHGTGLGLASAYGIIKNHRGKIIVGSVEGEGTTFTIYLPVSEKGTATEERIEGPVYEGRGTILFIDDEEAIREVGEEMLQEIGYDVILAENGQQGIALFADHRESIDLIILDILMPETSGVETFKKVREVSTDVKILLASGYSITEQTREMLEDAHCQFIAKPFNMRLLSRRIKEMLSDNPFLVANA
jgi:CheY-like chemotaxis protein